MTAGPGISRRDAGHYSIKALRQEQHPGPHAATQDRPAGPPPEPAASTCPVSS